MDTRRPDNPRDEVGNKEGQKAKNPPSVQGSAPQVPGKKKKERPLPPQYPTKVKKGDKVKVTGGYERIGATGVIKEIGYFGEIRVRFDDGFVCRKAERHLEVLE